jgi:hypothetical protein
MFLQNRQLSNKHILPKYLMVHEYQSFLILLFEREYVSFNKQTNIFIANLRRLLRQNN